jgi:hypothetical protein
MMQGHTASTSSSYGVLTGSFAVDIDSPAVASVDDLASVFWDVCPAEWLRRQGIVRRG